MLDTQTQGEYKVMNALVKAMTGYALAEVPVEKQQELAENCYSLYHEFLLDYFRQHFEKRDVTRFQAMGKYAHPNLQDDPDLLAKYREANQVFLAELSLPA